MIFDLLSRKNNMTYNLKMATIFGVCSAIFLSLLIDTKEENLYQLVDEKYFMLSRQTIYDYTGLDDLKQLEVEDNLKECNLIEVLPVKNNSDKFYYSLDENLLQKFLEAKSTEDAKKLLTKSARKKSLISVPRTTPPSKRALYIDNLKKSIKEEDVLLREDYLNWIDSVYGNPKGYLSVSSIQQCIKTLNEFSKGNKQLERDIVKIAIKNGWRNIDWAIQEYKDKNMSTKNLTITEDIPSEVDLEENIKKIKAGDITQF